MAERVVRFTEQFFDRLEAFLPEERGPDGSPSLTDFLLLDLPVIRDRLAADYEGVTMGTDDLDVRVYVGRSILVARVAVYVALDAGNNVEAFWVDIDTAGRAPSPEANAHLRCRANHRIGGYRDEAGRRRSNDPPWARRHHPWSEPVGRAGIEPATERL